MNGLVTSWTGRVGRDSCSSDLKNHDAIYPNCLVMLP